MQDRGLLYIPDISGFTRFVNATDIVHSRMIIQELLEVIINSNQLDLEVSEVEGDAVLFYKFGDPPKVEELFEQVAQTFRLFHQNLVAYDLRKYCQCNACMSAVNLSLKVITHYGEFSTYQVKEFKKLIGKDVIVAHQLLKNEVPGNEYWLATNDVLGREKLPSTDGTRWTISSKKTESGEIEFSYTPLSPLKKNITVPMPKGPDLSRLHEVVSVSRDYETDLIRLFHAVGDFNYRPRWMEGVIKVEEVGHFLPRIGMRCHYVSTEREYNVISSSYKYSDDRVEFTETEEGSDRTMYFVLEKLNHQHTRCTIKFFTERNFITNALFSLTRKSSLEITLSESLQKIDGVLSEIKLPAELLK